MRIEKISLKLQLEKGTSLELKSNPSKLDAHQRSTIRNLVLYAFSEQSSIQHRVTEHQIKAYTRRIA